MVFPVIEVAQVQIADSADLQIKSMWLDGCYRIIIFDK